MRDFKLFFITLVSILLLNSNCVFALSWLNDLRSLYTSNNAIIYEINIRTFNAKDKDGNGIITFNEQRGNFLNAIKRLNELSDAGINTVKIMPVLPVGKEHALGTAGSLFAPVKFDKINPQLQASGNVYEEMRKFIQECHKRNIRVIVELPAFAGYDLYVNKPTLFLKNSAGSPITPQGYSDVRILNAGSENNINENVYKLYSNFIKMMTDLSVDGISVSMPESKPFTFWKRLIEEARAYDPEMLFVAEISQNSKEILNNSIPVLSKDKLLEAGFDGINGTYNNVVEDLKTNLINTIKTDIAMSQKYNNKKSVYTNFSSYDTPNPIIKNGEMHVRQLIWFGATLPFNIGYVDGFSTGDNYMYMLSNKKAKTSFTDDTMYFMKRGQIDIYNFSRKPEGPDYNIYSDFVLANKFRSMYTDLFTKGSFITLKNSNPNVVSYARSYNNMTVLVIANTEKIKCEKVSIKIPKINPDIFSVPVKISASVPKLSKNEIVTNLDAFETQVLLLQNFNLK